MRALNEYRNAINRLIGARADADLAHDAVDEVKRLREEVKRKDEALEIAIENLECDFVFADEEHLRERSVGKRLKAMREALSPKSTEGEE